jgi:RNA polymerase sigma-32 factor
VTSNLRLVVKIAMEYRRNWVNAMDLIQEGNLGLMEAVKRFDPMRGVRFSSFARYWIRALILQYILKNFRMVSFANTRAGRKLFFRLEKERAKLIALYGEATTKQLALNLGVDESDVEIANALKQAPISLSEPKWSQDQDGPSLIDTLQDKEMTPEAKVIQNEFQSMLLGQMRLFEKTLENERDIVIWRERLISEDPVALSELGERFHISRERVRQLENRIKKKLEQQIRDNLGEDFILNISPNRQKAKVDA